jgi:hypothetical protein
MLGLSYDTVKNGSTGMIFVFLAAAVIAMRFTQKVMIKVISFVILAGLAVGCWAYRSTLEECLKTCTCSVAGHKLSLPSKATTVCKQIEANLPGSTTTVKP